MISGLTANGIQVVTSDRTIIRTNLIGSDPTGLVELGNAGGISIGGLRRRRHRGDRGRDRGTSSRDPAATAIYVTGSENVLIAGNLIGTDLTGTHPMPNNFGMEIDNITSTITIGGTAPAARNIISGNSTGLRLNSAVHGATIQNNYFGTDITGTLPLPNSVAIVVNIQTATDILIGGPNPGEGNVIVSNQAGSNPAHGILTYGQRITVRGNSIHGNQGLGFDIDPVGVNPNDPGDSDGGANDGQNFPIVTSVEVLSVGEGIGTRVLGVLRSESNTQYTLDFYGNDGCTPRPQDFLEAQTYLGAGQVTTDGTGFTASTSPCPSRSWRETLFPRRRPIRTGTPPSSRRGSRSRCSPSPATPRAAPPSRSRAPTSRRARRSRSAASRSATSTSPARRRSRPPLPLLSPGTVNDLTVTNTDTTTGTLPKAWVADFLDVPDFHIFNPSSWRSCATASPQASATASTGAATTRSAANGRVPAQGKVRRLLRAAALHRHRLRDVPCPSTFGRVDRGPRRPGHHRRMRHRDYCPQNPVRRDQMAVFLLKAKYGSAYVPPPCTGAFDDVACPGAFAVDFIEQLAEENITGGCGTNPPLYCPLNNNTRGQMAVFVVKTFSLQ